MQPPGHPHLAGGRGPGLLLLIAMTGYTVKNAGKNDVFSWSCFSGWLALPFSVFAGNLDNGRGWRGDCPEDPLQRLPSCPPRKHHSDLPGTPEHTPLWAPADPTETPLEPQTPVPGVLPTIRPRTHPPPPALRSLPARLLLSAGGHDHADLGCHQWIPRVLMTAAAWGRIKELFPLPRLHVPFWGT